MRGVGAGTLVPSAVTIGPDTWDAVRRELKHEATRGPLKNPLPPKADPMTGTYVTVDEFTINRDEAMPPIYVKTNAWIAEVVEEYRANESTGQVLVALDVDHAGSFVWIEGNRSNQLDAMLRARDALETAIDALMQLGVPRGQCSQLSDEGRCQSQFGHLGQHDFPSGDDSRADLRLRSV
jgi:hypothetical protein